MDTDVNTSLVEFFLSSQSGGGPAGLLILIVVWCAGYCGFSVSIVFVMAFCVYGYWHRQTRRLRRQMTWGLQTVVREPLVARAILGADLPQWAMFSSVEKSQWLQNLLTNLWPSIAKATRASVVGSLDPILEKYRPQNLLTALRMGYVDFGDVPPVIDGVQTHKSETETVIDLHVFWCGNPDVRVEAAMGPVSVEAAVTNLQLKALVRLTLGPHCAVWPCFGSISVSFVGKPTLDFHLRAAKIPFDAIPGLSSWLDGFIRNTLTWLLVYPRRMVFRVVANELIQAQEVDVEPIGCLVVNIHSAEGLPDAGLFSSLSTYVEVTSTMGDEARAVRLRTRAVKGRSPVYDDTEINRQQAGKGRKRNVGVTNLLGLAAEASSSHSSHMQFPVYHVPGEQITIEVKQTQRKATTQITKLIFSDTPIGRIELLVGSLLNERYEATSRLVCVAKPTADVGSVAFSTEYRPFVRHDDGGPSSSFEATTSGLFSPRNEVAAPVPGAGDGHGASPDRNMDVTTPLRSSRSMRLQRQASGLLLIHLIKADNLIISDIGGSSDPYVVFRIGHRSVSSPTVYTNLNPKYDVKLTLRVDDAFRDLLDVSVFDEDKVSKHDLLGKTLVSLSDVHQNHDRLAVRAHPLDTQGTVTFSLKLLIFA